MAKRREVESEVEVKDDSKEWGNLTTDEKVEKLKSLFVEYALRSGESDLFERITKGDPSFKLSK